MAGERKQPVRRQQSPQRVQQAAQAMQYSSPSGVQRGYIPQNTGGFRTPEYPQQGPQRQGYPPQGSQGQGYPTQGSQGQYPQQGSRGQVYPPQGQGYPPQGIPPQEFQQTPPKKQNTGSMQYVSSTGGGTRGFVVPGAAENTPVPPPPKQPKSSSRKILVRIISLAAAIIVIGAGVFILTENNKKAEDERTERQRVARMQEELARYDNQYFPGVCVNGHDLGGMTPAQAKATLESQINQGMSDWHVTLTYQGTPVVTYTADSLGMKATDLDDVLNQAWEPGHFGTLEERYDMMIRLRQIPYEAYTSIPTGDNTQIDKDLASIEQQLRRDPVNATVSEFRADLDEPFVYTDEVYGMTLDTQQLKSQIYHMVSTLESGTLEIVPDLIAPEITRADLEKMYKKRSSVITPIDRHSSDNRNDNIRLAFSKMNGYRLDPGKTFSFNKVVGARSTKNNFKTAIEYVYGEHVEGVGGGVCQASTTLFQAALLAGLEIRERHAHSDYVSYTGYGKDATVSDTKGHEKDMRFKNTTDYPIYIRAEVTEDPTNKSRLICKVTIYGIDPGNVRYELTSECVEILAPPYEPQYIKDKNAEYVTYTDQQKKVSDAKEGYVYKSYLVKYVDEVAVERKELYTDTYKAQPEKIYVGVTTRGEE